MVDITTHGTGIGYSVGQAGQNIANSFDGIMITKDFNLINIDFYLEYKVSDPVAYLFNSRDPELILNNIALASIRSTVIDYTVDEAMTTGKSAIQADVKEKMVSELQEQDIGIQVVNITIQDAEPPTQEIILAFKEVETAKQSAETRIKHQPGQKVRERTDPCGRGPGRPHRAERRGAEGRAHRRGRGTGGPFQRHV